MFCANDTCSRTHTHTHTLYIAHNVVKVEYLYIFMAIYSTCTVCTQSPFDIYEIHIQFIHCCFWTYLIEPSNMSTFSSYGKYNLLTLSHNMLPTDC